MNNQQRVETYLRDRSQLTPAQRRRVRKSENKAARKALPKIIRR